MTSDLVTEKTQPRILVACVGNIFFGDDGFGIEVARRSCSVRAINIATNTRHRSTSSIWHSWHGPGLHLT